ncbi:hypothetical protein FRC10_005465 [Ceratobasidium sp. 414]|nr:hypothetical protein FRC10_005465 [Ceratobasidium sp. 414]
MARQTKGKGKAVSRGSDDDDDRRGNSDQARNIDQALEKAKKRKATGKSRPVDSEEEESSEDEQVENARLHADNERFAADNERLMAEMAEIRTMLHRQQQQETGATGGASGSGSDCTNSAANGAPAAKPKKAPVPDKKTEVTIRQLRTLLGLEENEIRWLEIHSIIRDLISRVGLDFSLPWKLQDKTQLGTLYSLVRNRVPEHNNFANNWGAEYLVQETFNHRRSHRLSLVKRRDRPAVPAERRRAANTGAPAAPREDSPPRADTPPFGHDMDLNNPLPVPSPPRAHPKDTPSQCPRPRPHPLNMPAPVQANRSPACRTNADDWNAEPAPAASSPTCRSNPAPHRASAGGQSAEPAPVARAAEPVDPVEPVNPVELATSTPRSSPCFALGASKQLEVAEPTASTKRKAPTGGKAARKTPAKKAMTKSKAPASTKKAKAKAKGKGKGKAKGKTKAKGKGKGKGKATDEDEDEDEDDSDEDEDDSDDALETGNEGDGDDGTHASDDD